MMNWISRLLTTVAVAVGVGSCGSPSPVVIDASSDAEPGQVDAAPTPHLPPFWVGAFLTGGGFDTDNVSATLQQDVGGSLAVEQTYRSTAAAGIAKIVTDLNAIWARGAIPHLYIEPAKDLSRGWPNNYRRSQYEASPVDDEIARDMAATASEIAKWLASDSSKRLLFSFGAEMNGGWTPWGCLTPSVFVGLHSKMRAVLSEQLAAQGVDSRRVVWIYAPDSRGSTKRQDGSGNDIPGSTCNNSAAAYYPGHSQSDYIGLSAYRSGEQSVQEAVIAPAHKLLTDLQFAPSWQARRFIVLQTGSRDNPTRAAFVAELFQKLAADEIFVGAIWFNAAGYAVINANGKQSGYAEFAAALATHRGNPQQLFERVFWDVPPSHPHYGAVLRLATLGIGGCATTPRQFCPEPSLTRSAAAVFLEKVFAFAPQTPPSEFADVPTNHPLQGTFGALVARGAMTPCGNGLMCPDAAITPADLRAAVTALGGTAPAIDLGSSTISRATGAGFIVGSKQ